MTSIQTAFAQAFTEWERRYREEPSRFRSETEKLLYDTPETYGESCAPYFLEILAEQGVIPEAGIFGECVCTDVPPEVRALP